MTLLQVLPLFLVGIIDIVLALLVLTRDTKRINNIAFAVFATSMGGWIIGVGAFLLTNEPSLALSIAKLYYVFPLVIAISGLYFALTFPSEQKIKSKAMPIAWVGLLVLALPILFVKGFMLTELVYQDWGKQILLNPVVYSVYGLYVVGFFTLILVRMYAAAQHKTGYHAQQAKLFFTGLCAAAAFGLTFNLILPFLGNYRLIYLGPLFNSIAVIALAYAIVKHKMFDIRLVVARSLAYVGSLGVIAAVFGFIVFGISELLLNQSYPLNFQITLSLTTAIMALGFASVKKFFDRATNTLFYQDAYDTQVLLDQLNKVVVGTTDVDVLLRQAIEVLGNNLKAQFAFFGLRETAYFPQRIIGSPKVGFSAEEVSFVRSNIPKYRGHIIVADDIVDLDPKLYKIMQKHDIAILAQLVTTIKYETEGLGYMALGIKKSGNPYSKQDISVVSIIANELVIAIENALRYEEIENFNVTLQDKVDDATKKLKKANDKLTALDETKDEFISMASHQLRTPLTSVKGYLSMVLEGDAGKLNDMQRKLLEQSFTSSQRMVFLIADLLNLSRLRTGKFLVEPVPTNLSDIIQGEVEQLKETAAARSLKLEYDKPETFPTLMLDETKIRQVIMNFVDNAIYYTPSGGKIVIGLAETPKSIEFTVKDSGIGVPKSEQQHLFSKFFRAGNAQKARPDGTGLGLFMAKKVIVALGGALIFSSKEGQGSTFGFSFSKDKIRVPDTPQATPDTKL